MYKTSTLLYLILLINDKNATKWKNSFVIFFFYNQDNSVSKFFYVRNLYFSGKEDDL